MGDNDCYQFGHVTAGVRQKTGSMACPTRQFTKQSWLEVSVVVTEATSSTYLQGELVKDEQPMQHPRAPRGGIVIHRGFYDHITFRNLRVQSVNP